MTTVRPNHSRSLEELLQNPVIKTTAGVALVVLALAGSIAAPAATPRLMKTLYRIYRLQKKSGARALAQKHSTQVLYYLKRTGAVRFRKTKSEIWISLTSIGRRRLKKLTFETLYIPRPKKWDGKWWLVAADIPTKEYRIAAECLRYKLVHIGFKSLQRTLWLHPFDPRKEVEEIAQHYGVEMFVTVMEINRLDTYDEHLLRTYFRKQNVL